MCKIIEDEVFLVIYLDTRLQVVTGFNDTIWTQLLRFCHDDSMTGHQRVSFKLEETAFHYVEHSRKFVTLQLRRNVRWSPVNVENAHPFTVTPSEFKRTRFISTSVAPVIISEARRLLWNQRQFQELLMRFHWHGMYALPTHRHGWFRSQDPFSKLLGTQKMLVFSVLLSICPLSSPCNGNRMQTSAAAEAASLVR